MRTKLKTIIKNKLGLKGEIEKKNYKKVKLKKTRNQKNKDYIKKHSTLQIGIEGLN